MTDRELLEAAARAAGMDVQWRHWPSTSKGCFYLPTDLSSEADGLIYKPWNPLTDDGDALRLAVKLRLNLNFEEWDGAEYACAVPHKSHQGYDEVIDDDPCAATRRAIVRAAASMGEKA